MILKDKSATFKQWIKYDSDDLAEQFTRISKIPKVSATILANRLDNIDMVDSFLNPKIKNQMQSPLLLQDMQQACDILLQAIKENQQVLILSDYDVDGITSATILSKYLKHLQGNIQVYIPDRYTEGYGLSALSLANILKLNFDVLVLLDNGSSSTTEVATLLQHNKQVIIIDHHAVDVAIPPAQAFINPKRVDDLSKNENLCTVGLVFLYIVALNRILQNENYFIKNHINPVNILDYLDLVALGTVADMVPLIGLNRAYVLQGIKILQQRKNLPLKTLADALKINKPLETSDLAYSITPCINAGSRMGFNSLSFDLLNASNEENALKLAEKVVNVNNNRKIEEDKIIQAAVQEIKEQKLENDSVIFVGSKHWIAGVVGIIAGRVKEIYHLPTCIFSIDTKTNTATASGRSIAGIDLGNVIIAAKQKGLLIKGGGHAQAVGFTFHLAKQEELFQFLNQKVSSLLAKQDSNIGTFMVDNVLAIHEINQKFTAEIQNLQPFGSFFAEPYFMLPKVVLQNVKQIGNMKNHISCEVYGNYNFKLKAFCYKCIPSLLGEFLLQNNELPVDLLVSIQPNFFRGKYYNNLIIKDVAPCEP